MSEWINVKEKLPDSYDNVLVWLARGELEIGRYNVDVNRWFSDSGGEVRFIDSVIYWLPLPQPPMRAWLMQELVQLIKKYIGKGSGYSGIHLMPEVRQLLEEAADRAERELR